jgi:hypothetical protein
MSDKKAYQKTSPSDRGADAELAADTSLWASSVACCHAPADLVMGSLMIDAQTAATSRHWRQWPDVASSDARRRGRRRRCPRSWCGTRLRKPGGRRCGGRRTNRPPRPVQPRHLPALMPFQDFIQSIHPRVNLIRVIGPVATRCRCLRINGPDDSAHPVSRRVAFFESPTRAHKYRASCCPEYGQV